MRQLFAFSVWRECKFCKAIWRCKWWCVAKQDAALPEWATAGWRVLLHPGVAHTWTPHSVYMLATCHHSHSHYDDPLRQPPLQPPVTTNMTTATTTNDNNEFPSVPCSHSLIPLNSHLTSTLWTFYPRIQNISFLLHPHPTVLTTVVNLSFSNVHSNHSIWMFSPPATQSENGLVLLIAMTDQFSEWCLTLSL